MAQGPRYHLKHRRRREGRTDYRRRLALLRSGKPRAVVRRTNRNFIVQFVAYDETGDEILAQAEALELPDHGWDRATANTPGGYLTGLLAGTRAAEVGVEEAVLDIGHHHPSPGGNLFAVLKGILDAGIEVPHGDDIFPPEERLQGAHIGPDVPGSFAATAEAITGEPVEPVEVEEPAAEPEPPAAEDAAGEPEVATEEAPEDGDGADDGSDDGTEAAEEPDTAQEAVDDADDEPADDDEEES